jgi:general secretion pathway protein A
MYERYYSLDERPFAITPDPRYVYLSPRHQEALAHLLYGVGTGGSGGFVLLTGEVGTGKTTLCRLVLEQAPEATQIALILNPMLSPLEFLQALCAELEVVVASAPGGGALKLQHALNRYLLERHAAGERVVLIVDEAQCLPRDTLEQIRLLTNLETATDKLLQIILIGQPELKDSLRQPALRQLSQRITARYHLDPLDLNETAEYVRHRMTVAGAERNPFKPSALKALHQLSEGVPRRINVIADRALLAGYAHELERITPATVRAAAREVIGEGGYRRNNRLRAVVAIGLLALVIGGGLSMALTMQRAIDHETTPLSPVWRQLVDQSHPDQAWREMAAWIPQVSANEVADACLNPRPFRAPVACLILRGSWAYIETLGRPVLLRMTRPHDTTETMVVMMVAQSDGHAILQFDGQRYQAPIHQLERQWLGEFMVVWPDSGHIFQRGDRGSEVAGIKRLAGVQRQAAWEGNAEAHFDAAFEQWVMDFQARHGIASDGMVGPATRLFLTTGASTPPRE